LWAGDATCGWLCEGLEDATEAGLDAIWLEELWMAMNRGRRVRWGDAVGGGWR